MTDKELFDVTREVLELTGPPTWESAEAPDVSVTLFFFEEEDSEAGHMWCLSWRNPAQPRDEELIEDIPIETSTALDLIKAHLARWLMERAWQTQLSVRKGKPLWRLADCLSMAEGGGDRLDADYPTGEDELLVLCESVRAVNMG